MGSAKRTDFILRKARFDPAGLALLLFALTVLRPAANAADWPLFRGNNARTGYASEQAYPPLTAAWAQPFQAGGGIISSPAVFGDVVYFGARDNKVYALNAPTGTLLWAYRTGGWVDSSPAVSGGAVYVSSMDGYLYALNRLTGALLWRAALGASSVSSPLVLDGKVFVGCGAPGNMFKVFDTATGSQLYQYAVDEPVDSAPSTDGTLVYFGGNDGKIYAINKTTYSQAWYYQTMGGSYGMNAVAVSSGVVYALPGHDEKRPVALNAGSGVPLLYPLAAPFDVNSSWEQLGSPVAADGRLYFSGGAGGLAAGLNIMYALDTSALDSAQAGQEPPYVWTSSPTLGNTSSLGVLSSPAMAGGMLYAGTSGGELMSVTQAEAPSVVEVMLSSSVYSSPAVSNGRVYVGAMDGKFSAYKAAKTVSISSPAADAVVSGTVAVNGYLSDNTSTSFTGYTLEYGAGDAPASWLPIPSGGVSPPVENGALAVWNTTGLGNGFYTLRLTAIEDPVSAADNTALLRVRVNTPPLPPSGLAAVDVPGDNGNKIRLSWSASSSAGLTAYNVFRDAGSGFIEIASVGPSALTCVDSAAVTGTTFSYAVRAFDGYVESVNSSSVSAHSVNNTGDDIPPAAIADLAAVPGAGGGAAELYWTAPGNDGELGTASYYIIKYTTAPGYNWSAGFDGASLSVATRAVEGPAGDNMSTGITGLLGGVTYYFAVKTADFAGNKSLVSNSTGTYAALDYIPPLAPAGLTVVDTPGDDGGRLTLDWTLSPDDGAGAGDVYGYKIYRRTQNSVYVSSEPYASVLKGVKTYLDPAATKNIRFYYAVAAFDSTNNSTLTNEADGISADNWRFFDAAQGGVVRLLDGAVIDVPGGAASQNDEIMVSRLSPSTYQPLAALKSNTVVKPTPRVYEVKFKNPVTKLNRPATITLPYSDTDVGGMNQNRLRIYTLTNGAWLLLPSSKTRPELQRVTAEIDHFSIFSIMEYVPSGALLDEAEVYTYPNPARGDTLTFKFLPADDAYVKIDVYNVAGERVARLEKAGCPGGTTGEIVWRLGNVASGVYIYKLEARSASGTKSVIKKLAVIH